MRNASFSKLKNLFVLSLSLAAVYSLFVIPAFAADIIIDLSTDSIQPASSDANGSVQLKLKSGESYPTGTIVSYRDSTGKIVTKSAEASMSYPIDTIFQFPKGSGQIHFVGTDGKVYFAVNQTEVGGEEDGVRAQPLEVPGDLTADDLQGTVDNKVTSDASSSPDSQD